MADEKIGSKPRSGLSTAGLVLGILSVALFWIPFVRPVLSILAIIFGGISTSKKEKYGLAGLILGIASWLIWILIFVIAGVAGGLSGL